MPAIEVINYERANKNKVIGYVDIKIPAWKMIIRKIAHLQSGEKRWFNLPQFARDQGNGTQKFLRYWEMELEVHNGQLMEQLAQKVKEFCDENKIPEVEALDLEENLPF